MNYKIMIDEFEGPLDLLLHLIKQSDIDICDISIVEITEQYFNYIHTMEDMNLNIASEYLVMAAELIEIKSHTLLPNKKECDADEYEEDPREQLINRLLLYKQYKEVTSTFKQLEEERQKIYTKDPSDMKSFISCEPVKIDDDLTLHDLMDAFNRFLKKQLDNMPLNTKVTKKELSVSIRSNEIRKILKEKKKVEFTELFQVYNREYVVVTFLSVLDLAKKQVINIKQDQNFNKIYLLTKGSE
jgi:segregation and condensation protein A